jgi:hypothetical protein
MFENVTADAALLKSAILFAEYLPTGFISVGISLASGTLFSWAIVDIPAANIANLHHGGAFFGFLLPAFIQPFQ